MGGFGTALSRFADLEAVLPDRTYFQGRYWERRIYAVSRDHWVGDARARLHRYCEGAIVGEPQRVLVVLDEILCSLTGRPPADLEGDLLLREGLGVDGASDFTGESG